MIVQVKDDDDAEFIRIMTKESKNRYFRAIRRDKYHIMDEDFMYVKHIAKRCRV